MVAGIVLGEVLFPLEGFRGNGRAISNDTVCLNNIEGTTIVMAVCCLVTHTHSYSL